MKNIMSVLGSMKTACVLLALYAVGLAAATFIEHSAGTAAARSAIYHNYAFMALQLLMVASFAAAVVRYGLWRQRKAGSLVFHFGLAVVLAGALVTHVTGYEGIVHIRQGETVSDMVDAGGRLRRLPFSIRLDEFRLTRYPGSNSPSSFESLLTITADGRQERVSVATNRVYRAKGFRLFQSSYDRDEKGTVLTANYDPAGVGITYAGYLLLLVGMVLMPLHPQSRVRVLVRSLSRKGAALAAVLLALPFAASAGQAASNTVPAHVAERMGKLLVQTEGGRIEPLDTYAGQLLRKIYRGHKYEGLDPVQVVAGLALNPGYWMGEPVIRQTDERLRDTLDYAGGDYMSLYDMFSDEGVYKLSQLVPPIYEKAAEERGKFDKNVLKLDEKSDIVYMLAHGLMLRLFPLPDDPSGRWYSAGDDLGGFGERDSMFVRGIMTWLAEETAVALRTGDWAQAEEVIGMIGTYQKARSTVELPSERKVRMEILYNKTRVFFFSAMGYMALGLVLLALSVAAMFRRGVWLRRAGDAAAWLVVALFAALTAGIAVRWYISGQPPWSNGYETMVQVGWAAALAGLLFARRSKIAMALASFLAGVVLFVANLNWMDPAITPLVPVLQSPWLMIHVSLITASYGFFGMCFLLGVLSLAFFASGRNGALSDDMHRLRVINEISVNIGLCLLTAGTFVGAIWANESWGRYWGWDPKETWALITMIVYALVIHVRFIPRLASDYAFAVMSVFASGAVMMTYFGVNYYLSGMHSYGGGDTPPALNVVFAVYGVLAVLAVVAGWRLYGRKGR